MKCSWIGWMLLVALTSLGRPLGSSELPALEQTLDALGIPLAGRGITPPGLSHGPLVGAVSDTTAKIWARVDGASPASYSMAVEFGEVGDPTGTVSSMTPVVDNQDYTGTVEISGLATATEYWFRIWIDGAPVVGSDGSFATSPAAGTPASFRFGLGSCNDHLEMPYPLLTTLAGEGLAFFLHLGDIIYADRDPAATTRSEFEARYKLNFAETHWRDLMSGLPTLMTWDDHEIENDWAGGQSGLYVAAREAFDEYVSSHNPDPRLPGELYFTHQAGDTEFFVLDTRSHRNPALGTMLGAAQKNELLDWLASSQATFKFIVSSVQFSDITQKSDLWFGYPAERAEIFAFIRQRSIRGVVLLSGDRHWTGVFRHTSIEPFYLYEISSSPLGAAVSQAPPAETSTLHITDTERTYVTVGVDTTVEPAILDIRVRNLAGSDLYQLVISEEDIVASVVFSDGFESGDPSVWSSTAP